MAKVKTTSKFQILDLIDNFVDKATVREIGETIVTEAKENISQGLSPVRGYGRFEKYKNPKKYPGELKNQRPVNLELTGEMMDAYDYREGKKDVVNVGVYGSSFAREKARYHQEGTDKMAQRKLIPGDGEEWSVSIMRKLREVYSTRLKFLIRQSNKKG